MGPLLVVPAKPSPQDVDQRQPGSVIVQVAAFAPKPPPQPLDESVVHPPPESTPDFGPKLDLPCDGSFQNLARDPRIQQQLIRNHDWMTHTEKVARR